MKKNIVACFYCLIMFVQVLFCLTACETMSGKETNDVMSAGVDERGQLILTLENGDKINVGVVVGGNGLNGKDGENGLSAYELYLSSHPDYQGNEETWLKDLTEGNLKDRSYTYGLSYTPLEDGTLGVSIGTAGQVSEIVIPSVYEGYPVTAILDGGFQSATDLKSVFLPSSIVSIGVNAFRCCVNLESVVFPPSLEKIGAGAFDYCTKLQVTDLRENVE